MYPHRLVVDANCINAKERLAAMTALEAYHNVGALELIVTSTLPIELDRRSVQARKAALYQSVGAYLFYFPGELAAQSQVGAAVRSSLLHELHTGLFGHNLSGAALLRAVRDALQLDQAQMNGADIFVTNDKRLYAAEQLLEQRGVRLAVCTPERALEHVRRYYVQTVGGDKLEDVEARARDQGPVILGSNSCADCVFVAARTEEVLAAIRFQDGLLRISAKFRDDRGRPIVELKPGQRPEFADPNVRITSIGRGPILVAEEPSCSAVISSDQCTYLAVRMTRTRRAVISDMALRDDFGQLVAAVEKEDLRLGAVKMSFDGVSQPLSRAHSPENGAR